MKKSNNTTIISQTELINTVRSILQENFSKFYTATELKNILDSVQYATEEYLKLPLENDNTCIRIKPFGNDGSLFLESHLDSGSTRILNGHTIVTQPRVRVRARYSNYFKRKIMNNLSA